MAVDFSRRTLVDAIFRAKDLAGLKRTLGRLGLMPVPAEDARPPELPPKHGRGRKVVILGAGIAGMTAAYRLRNAGYSCKVLEARARPGCRVWTLRAGDKIVETDSSQRVGWKNRAHLYLNAGAARISQHHTGLLWYCRHFGIPLEVFVSDNRAALLQTEFSFGGKPQQLRRVIMDSRGAIAAMAAMAARNAPNPPSRGLMNLLTVFGNLQPDMTYAGTGWAGYEIPPGAGLQAGVPLDPLPLDEIANAVRDLGDPRFFNPLIALVFSEIWNQSATMLQPVGGMDTIPRAFAKRLGSVIRYGTQVTRIERLANSARIAWRNSVTGRTGSSEADFVICTLPLTVLQSIPADFSHRLQQAIGAGAQCYIPAGKVGFYSERRWWETDHQLYGGISWTSGESTQLWYPSHGFPKKDGILVGAYLWDSLGDSFARKPPPERLMTALNDGERLHPGYYSLVRDGVSVAWPKIPFSQGGWCEWTDDARAQHYPALVAGEGPFFFAGEHVSYVQGWQEGAVQSAHHVIRQIAGQVSISSRTAN